MTDLAAAPRANQAHLMRFRGVVHPTGEDNDYDGLFLTKDDIDARARDIVGTPIWCEHKGTKKIGWVTAGSVNSENQLVVDGAINRNTFEGARVSRRMRSGKLTGLSLGVDHMVREDPTTGIQRVLTKTIGEVSVTEDPDRPDTFISAIAPDSEMWDLTRRRVVGGLEKRRTKNALNKKKVELLGLFKQATADLESDRIAAQLNSAHTKEGIDPGAGSIGRKDEPMSAPEAQQPPAAAADLSEVEMMRQKIAQMEADKQQLQAQLSEQDGMVQAWRDNPDKLKEIVARHNSKLHTLQEKMAEDEKDIIDKVTADMLAAGVDPEKNPEIFETIKSGKEQPEAYKALYQLLKTTAGAASEKRATIAEAGYQAKNAEAERLVAEKAALQQRLDTADAARLKVEGQFQQQHDHEQRAQQLAGFVGDLSASRPAKRARDTAAEQQQEQAAASAAPAVQDNSAYFGGGSAPANFGVHAPFVANVLDTANEQLKGTLLGLFDQGRGRVGMGRLDVPGLMGRDYGKMTTGVNADGSIDMRASEIRSQRPPIALAADMPHQA